MLKYLFAVLVFYSVGSCAVQRPVVTIVDNIVTASCILPEFRENKTPLPASDITSINFYYGEKDNLGQPELLTVIGNICKSVLPIKKRGKTEWQLWVTLIAGAESQPGEVFEFIYDNPSPPGVATDLNAEVN